MMKSLSIILDTAHGSNVPGKQSPDGKHKEYIWSRHICNKLYDKLLADKFLVYFTNTGETEIGLTQRVKNANRIPGRRKLLISIHNNAATLNSWSTATGVEIYTTKGKTRSDACAEIILRTIIAEFPELSYRMDKSDGDSDKESNFTVLTGETYMAVLLEWLFQDNKADLALIENQEYNDRLVNCLVKAVNQIDQLL